ncbi:MAG TPA: hypothetical protein VF228_15425 [Iamia sp.]
MRTGGRALAGVCALTLLLAACGGEEDSADVVEDGEQTTEAAADDATTTTAAADEPDEPDDTTTTTADEPDDSGAEGDPDAVALAERVNLTIDDFDETWTETPPESDDGGATIDDCFVETDIEAVTVGEAETGTFANEVSDEAVQLVTMQTVVLDSAETAASIVGEFSREAFAGCAVGIMQDGFGEGATAELALRPDDPVWAEESTGLVGDISVPNRDGTLVAGVVDLHIFRTAEVVSFTATVDLGDVGVEGLLSSVYVAVAGRHQTEIG